MIPLCVPEISGNEWNYVKECLDTNWVSSVGSYVDLFEEKFKKYSSVEYSVVTMNGTAAITLALQTLGIGNGDEVIVPSMTFIASVNPVKYVGAEPVFVDVTRDTWTIDVTKIEELITKRTRAIIPVHLYGNMVDMEPLMNIAKKHNLYVIEDATEALGSEYKTSDGVWHNAGTLGDFGIFSFNGNKIITTGAGGMLVTNNKKNGEFAKYLSTQSKTILPNGGFVHDEIGYNYRMPNLLAAVGVAQMENLKEYLHKKIEHTKLYDSILKEIKGISFARRKENIRNSRWLYSIVIEEQYSLNRDELILNLKKNNIDSRPFFSPIHLMKPYLNSKNRNLEVTDYLTSRGINLPSSVGLSKNDIMYICEKICEFAVNGGGLNE